MEADFPKKREFSLRYIGQRFDGAKLPVDVLSDLPAFRDLIAAFAKEIWRQENASRKRLPRGFEQSLAFDFVKIVEGSAIPSIAWDRKSAQQNLPGISDYLDNIVGRAHERAVSIFNSVSDVQSAVTLFLPKVAVRALDRFGSSLRETEKVEFVNSNDSRGEVIFLNAERRRRLIKVFKETYESRISGQGILMGLSVENGWIQIQTPDLGIIHVQIEPSEVHEVFDGNTLQPVQYDLSVQLGRDDELKSVLRVHEITLIDEAIDAAINKASERINAICELPQGWKDGEGEKVERNAAENVLQLVARRSALASKFRIYPTLEGGVQIELEASGWDIGIEMLPSGQVELYGVHLTDNQKEIGPSQFPNLSAEFLSELDRYVRD